MEYTNIAEMFARLNAAGCEYLVLRNYENLLEDEIYMAGHGDIDMLCRDAKEIVDVIGAKTCRPQYGEMGDNTHFYIMYKGQRVSIDLRSVSDGYYCKEWAEEMLRTRVLHECFYVMNEENHLYSLIYHAIFQKPQLSDEYQLRLSRMQGEELLSEKQLIDQLEHYMREHGYRYVYCKDYYVPLRHCMGDKTLCNYTWGERWPHLKFELRVNFISLLVRVKHAICSRK